MDNDEHTGPINIGNPTEFTMLELANVVKEVVNPDAEIVFRENTADDPNRRKPDITKVRALSASPAAVGDPATAWVLETPSRRGDSAASRHGHKQRPWSVLDTHRHCTVIRRGILQAENLDPRCTTTVCSSLPVECEPAVQAKELLGWEPKVSLREGLASMVEDFRTRLHLDDDEKTNHSAK